MTNPAPNTPDEPDMRSLIEESVVEVAGDEAIKPVIEDDGFEEEAGDIVADIRKEFDIKVSDENEAAAKKATEKATEKQPDAPKDDDQAAKPVTSSLSDDDQKALATITPEARAIVDRLQNETSTLGEIRKVFEPFAEAVKQSGLSEVQIIKGWADLYKFAQTDPTGYAKHVLGALNIDPATLIEKPAGQQQQAQQDDDDDDPFVDDETRELRKKVKELTAQQQQAPSQDSIERARWETRIEMFETATDASGNLINPYFKDVQREIGLVAQRMRADGQPIDLAKAYAEACRLNPEISARVEADRKKQAEDAEKRKLAHERQKRAASSVKSDGTAIDTPPKFEDLDLRKQLRATAAAHGVRQL